MPTWAVDSRVTAKLQAEEALFAEKVLAAICAPHVIDGHAVRVSASIGISLYPPDGDDATALLRRADTAMYEAKAGGQNGYRFAGPVLLC